MNTTRPLFNFPLQRRSHRVHSSILNEGQLTNRRGTLSLWTTYFGGGYSGSVFYNDWLTTHEVRCFPPVDPSFADVLGAITLEPLQLDSTNREYVNGTFSSSADARFGRQSIRISCAHGHHFEPPLLDSRASITCQGNGMWMDESVLTIRRCVKNKLNCSWPLTDLGGLYCEPALPILQELHATYQYNRTQKIVPNADAVTLIDVPVLGDVTLSIVGSVFFNPVRVLIGGYPCLNPVLGSTADVDVSTACYNESYKDADVHLVCIPCARLITCTLPMSNIGVGREMAVVVNSGRIDEVTEVDPSIGTVATLTSTAPVVTRIRADSGDCGQDEQSPFGLLDCPITRTFQLTVCAASYSVGNGSNVLVMMDTSSGSLSLECAAFRPDSELPPVEMCTICTVFPRLTSARLILRQPTIGLDSQQPVSILFARCDAGYRTDYSGALSGNATDLCVACPPGSSTANAVSSYDCTPCVAGYFTNTSGSAMCSPCRVGTWAPSINSTTCSACPLNSYANSTAQTRCEVCELNNYIVYSTAGDVGVAGSCVQCPELTTCYANGTIAAQHGSYVLIDQDAGTVSSTMCSSSACMDASFCEQQPADAVSRIESSGLEVVNCCGDGRWPAFTERWENSSFADASALRTSHGHNVLCAACLPGHSSVNGRCIPCESTHYGALVGMLLLAFILIYLVHRLPHDWTGSATLLITTYFLQQSVLFLASESMPQMLSLVNVDLLGDHASSRGSDASSGASVDVYTGVCIVPLDDTGRITMSLVSPLAAFALLGALALLQLGVRMVLQHASLSSNEDGWVHRIYRLLFVPSNPKLCLSEQAPSVSIHSSQQLSTSLLQESKVMDLDLPHQPGSASTFLDRSIEDDVSVSPMWLSYQRSCVRLLQLSYTALAVVTLSFFHWQSVGEFGWRLVDYPTLSPESTKYHNMRPVVVCVLAVVVCGLPLAVAIFLWVAHRRGQIDEAKQLQRERTSSYSEALSVRHALLLQLTAMFRSEHWWMASFVLVRRLLLVALLVSVRGPQVWIWLSMVNYCLLAMHLHLKPYERVMDNTLESLTLLSLSVQTTLLSVWPPPYLSVALFGVFNALVIAPLVPLVLAVMSARWRQYKAARGTIGVESEHRIRGGDIGLND